MSDREIWISSHLEETAASTFPKKWHAFDENVQRDFYGSLDIKEQIEVYRICGLCWLTEHIGEETREHGVQV